MIYWQKSKEDSLLYSFLVKIEHYYGCEMLELDAGEIIS